MLSIIQENKPLTMSSVEIAELTGKKKSNVHRDIKVMLEQLSVDDSDLKHLDSRGYVDTYNLPKDLTITLVSGYNVKMRHAITKRWIELEEKQAPQLPQTFAEALQLAADQAKQLELQAPKVAFVDKLVEKDGLMTATQVAQKHGKSARWLNKKLLDHDVYSKAIKRSKVFRQWFLDKGYGEIKQSEAGFDQSLFTNAGEVWINDLLIAHGYV